MNEHEPFGYPEDAREGLDNLFDSKRKADWDHVDKDTEYIIRQLKRDGGNIDDHHRPNLPYPYARSLNPSNALYSNNIK